jgi:hypothetical protein
VQSQTSSVISGGVNDLGALIEVHQNCKFGELKVCLLNNSLASSASSSGSIRPLSKIEYGQRLKAFVIWSLDPSSSQWVQLRSQADWERVRFLKFVETQRQNGQRQGQSSERLKIMFDDGHLSRRGGGRSRCRTGTGDLTDSLADNMSMPGDSLSLDPPPCRLHLLSSTTTSSKQLHSPEKQQVMARILEQRILLSRI